MAKNQLAIPRYRVILRTLARQGQHASKDIYVACIIFIQEKRYRTKNVSCYL